MNRVRSGDAEIAFEVSGDGPPVVLLHPFPVDHYFWSPALLSMLGRYQVILPDLRVTAILILGKGPLSWKSTHPISPV